MATRPLLAALAPLYEQQHGVAVRIESVGGVDAARRVRAGEAFDVVVLASDALEQLLADGHVVAGSRTDIANSGIAVAVREGAAKPDLSSGRSVRAALLAAPSIGYSTGPSGIALLELFDGWGIADELRARLVQASPGIPVASLVASGEAALGFQQLSELMGAPGIDVAGPLPPDIQIVTTFSAGICRAATQPEAARALLRFMASSQSALHIARHGMTTA